LASLDAQGFRFNGGILAGPESNQKEALRRLHCSSVRHRKDIARAGLQRHEDRLLRYLASGSEIDPERIQPRLVEVQPDSENELLFRYARLHWSVPISAGYGRRLRYVIYDDTNGKLIGLFGLGDPVFNLAPRDRWIGWDGEARRARLQCAQDLFVLGAVPPYSSLLCGKLIAVLATSREVQEAFRRKYEGQTALISAKPLDGRLALLTTTSALGRSSLYNRIYYAEDLTFQSVGFTKGSGEFHFANGLYTKLRKLALDRCYATAKNASWGVGFRNRREVIRKALPLLGLSPDLLYHGIEREVFVAPLGHNARSFLRGDEDDFCAYAYSANDIFAWFRDRWLLPRSRRDQRYKLFDKEEYRIWKKTI
jgi:uncharacterized protein DUF4338